MRLALAFVTGLVLVAVAALERPSSEAVAAQSRQVPAGTRHAGSAFRFNKVKEGIVCTGDFECVAKLSSPPQRTRRTRRKSCIQQVLSSVSSVSSVVASVARQFRNWLFLTAALSNMSDAYVNEWVASLDELKKLDFDTVLPGHGEAFTDKAKIDYFQAYLRDVWTEVSRLKQQGVSAEEAAKRADLTKHREHFPGIQGLGVPLIGVTRIYELLDSAGRR